MGIGEVLKDLWGWGWDNQRVGRMICIGGDTGGVHSSAYGKCAWTLCLRDEKHRSLVFFDGEGWDGCIEELP